MHSIHGFERREREREREKKNRGEREKLSKKLVNISVIQERDNANQFINNLIFKRSTE